MRFKIGDAVVVVYDFQKCYIGCKGIIIQIGTNDSSVAIVKLNKPISELVTGVVRDANNDIKNNTRQFFEKELELDKNTTVINILNDL